MVIYRHKERYPISDMCQFFGVSRSGYYGFCKRIGDPESDAELAELLQSQQERCRQTYGYRRMWLWLEKQGSLLFVTPRAVRPRTLDLLLPRGKSRQKRARTYGSGLPRRGDTSVPLPHTGE